MVNYLSVFKSQSAKEIVIKLYDELLSRWPVPFDDIYISTKLGSTHIIVSGDPNAEPLILIHAYYATALSWFKNIEELSKYYRVYAVDMIGEPNKSKPVKPIRILSEIVEWFLDLMNGLHIEKSHFIGNSVGAYHIARFSLSFPDRINKMILIGPAATFLQIFPFYVHTFPGGMTGWNRLVKHAIRWIENSVTLDAGWKDLFGASMKYGISKLQVFPNVFTDDQLKKIVNPTLVVYGNRENIYNYNKAIRRINAVVPQVRIEIIQVANHITALSNPKLTNEAIIRFLKD